MANLSPMLALVRLTLLLMLVQQSRPLNITKKISRNSTISEGTSYNSMTSNATSRSAGDLPLPSMSTKSERRDQGFGRFIKFHSNTNDTMRINLDFSVPFLLLPLRREDPSLPPAPVEVNVRGILLAAGLGAVASIVVPALTGNSGPFSAFLPPHLDVPPPQAPPPYPTWPGK